MPSISEILQSKAETKQARTEDMKAERANLSEMRSGALKSVTQTPDLYEQYLVLQANNIGCSAGNIALTMFQLKDPTKLGTTDFWHDQGRYVRDKELDKGAKVDYIYNLNSQYVSLMNRDKSVEELCNLLQDVVENFMDAAFTEDEYGNCHVRDAVSYIAEHY